jgi:hypothetical protein
MGVALGYSGPIQIELIVQHNDAPSLYRDFLAERPQGGLLEATPTLLGFFEKIEKAARFWDGDEPHRIVGE